MTFPRSGSHLLLRVLISLGLMVSMLPIAAARVDAATEKPTLLGFTTSDWRADLPDFATEAGRSPAMFQVFWSIENDWPNAWVPGILTELEELGLTAYHEVTTDDLDALNSGDKDANLNAMAKTIADWIKGGADRRILVAPLPEMNLKKSPVHTWGGDPSGFKAGYQRIRDAFLNQGLTSAQIRFVFAPNGTSDVGEYDDYYPGDAVVDLIGFAKINRGDPWRDYETTFQMHIDELRAGVSLTKPILITQTGSVTENGNRDIWLDDMFTKLKAHDQVIGAIYFNRNKDHDYRVLVGGTLDPAFNEGYEKWSDPSEVSWIFDGRMDAWVQAREDAFGTGFTDVAGHIFLKSITWLADQGITEGCNPPANTKFCPDDSVTRGEMAVFISRALGLPATTNDYFIDDEGRFYENAANRLFEKGITVGCGAGRYCGDETISREQMAAFLARSLNLPSTNTDSFIDDDGSVFELAINKIAQANITVGCNPPMNDRFCPDAPVTRGQMATFINRGLGS